VPSFPGLGDVFKIVKEPSMDCSAIVVEAVSRGRVNHSSFATSYRNFYLSSLQDVKQEGVQCYIAIDSESYGHTARPGELGLVRAL